MMIKKNDKKNEKNNISIRDVLKYFIKKSNPYKRGLLIAILGSIIVSVVGLILPIYYTKITDIVAMIGIEKTELVSQLISLLWFIIGFELTNMLAWRMIGFSISLFSPKAMRDIYEECFQYLHKHSYRFFTNNFSGALLNKVNKLAQSYGPVVDIFVFDILNIIIFIPMTVVIVMKQSFIIGFLFVVFIIIYTILQVIFFKLNKKYELMENEQDSKTMGELSDTITNNFNILTFASLPHEFKRFHKNITGRAKLKKKKWMRSERMFCITGILTGLFEVGSIYFAIKARGNGLIQPSVIILVQMYVMKISNQLSSVRQILRQLNRTLGESTEMLKILNTPHEIQDKTNKKLKIGDGRIDFENVKFAYDNGEKIFDGLDLKIKPGEKIAIVGESGSGKSTLTKLLFRFFDIQGGKIMIDGQDISMVTQDSLRSQISIVPQEPILFHRTIRENIAYGNQNATEEEIIAAAKMAKCHDFIMKLKDGYESYVGERGIKLSGGERQRVAIARAILENKKILVMDEATSSLDSESEKCIQDAMDEVMRNKTCIVIAHRLSTINKMDKIIVMDHGKIAEKGSHNELVNKKNGIYHKLWNIQSGGFFGEKK